jgi:chromosome segregation ATPase
MAKAKEIRDLNFKLIELRQENRTTRDMLQNEVDAYRGRSAERERLAERLAGRVRELEDEIEELKKHKENKIVYGATEEIKPAIRHLDLDD